MCLATEQVNSTLEIDKSLSADTDHWSGEILRHGTKEAQKDVILWWGCRGQKSPCIWGRASKRGRVVSLTAVSGVRGSVPKFWGILLCVLLISINFLSFFQLGKMSMIGNFCTQLFQSGTRVNPKQWMHKVNCLRLCVNLFSKNKCLLFIFVWQ